MASHLSDPVSRREEIPTGTRANEPFIPRSAALRGEYLTTALRQIPRVLSSLDRNPLRPTFGCFDRQFWHYRTASFPSEMYQEGVLPLAIVYSHPMPGNDWYRQGQFANWIRGALTFSLRGGHRDGSCDDYYPFERAYGASAFSLQACARAMELLGLRNQELVEGLKRRAAWLATHDESGTLSNHHALAALGMYRVARLAQDPSLHAAADRKIEQLLKWQSSEGWFNEYGGADPGYQTVTIDCLAKCREFRNDQLLDEPLRRAIRFARKFLHPDESFAGIYGSRGTKHFYTHGLELMARENAEAADLADGFLNSLNRETATHYDDDRLFVHRLGNLLESYLDWSPTRPSVDSRSQDNLPHGTDWLPQAGMLVHRGAKAQTVAGMMRGGVFAHFERGARVATDSGLILTVADGRIAVSQRQLARENFFRENEHVAIATPKQPNVSRVDPNLAGSFVSEECTVVSTEHPLQWAKFETATPLKQAAFHVGMSLVGRWCRTAIRKVLQRRMITGKRPCPILHRREIRLATRPKADWNLQVIDEIRLLDRRLKISSMAFASDLQVGYVAASNVFDNTCLEPWTDLSPFLEGLHRDGKITLVRTW